ncbi:MAG: sigma-70 family RNA polymerase sigma factor [Lentisphaeria bacterium]|jgi:RNA polymerase sigma-70 factor (ECF subfamily)
MSKNTTETALTDAELVTRFQNGDRSAYEALVDRHSEKAYQIAYGVLGNREDAEEVAQDVFIRIMRALTHFRGDAEFTTWMYRIAINLARNKYRWNKSRGVPQSFSLDAPIEGGDNDSGNPGFDVPSPRLGPDGQAVIGELERNVMVELEKLPDIYREALVMRNMEELDYNQIADLLGCKLGTIKSRIARAREELRRRLNL